MIKDFNKNNKPVLEDGCLKLTIMRSINSIHDSDVVKKLENGNSVGMLALVVKMDSACVHYTYTVPTSYIPIKEYFEDNPTFSNEEANKIFKNLAGILINLKQKTSNILNTKNCVLNDKYIYINKQTKGIYYLYIPFKHNFEEINFGQYIWEIISNIAFDDQDFLSGLMEFVKEKSQLSAEDFHNFLVAPPKTEEQITAPAPAPKPPEPEEPLYIPPAPQPQPQPQPPPPPERKIPYLSSRSGTQRHAVNNTPFTIGKLEENDVVVNAIGISRRAHASIITENNAYYLLDMASTNGVLLNGAKIDKGQRYKLSDNDIIALRALTEEGASKNIEFIFNLL